MMQILYNLLHNAAKFTPKGGSIQVEATCEGAIATIKIYNDGDGLTDEQLSSLFTLYYRTEKSKREKRAGYGLGLFIVKMLVEAQAGTIEARSELGEGVTFMLRLPNFEG